MPESCTCACQALVSGQFLPAGINLYRSPYLCLRPFRLDFSLFVDFLSAKKSETNQTFIYSLDKMNYILLFSYDSAIIRGMQIWFIGRTLASQAGKAGSTPVICFFCCLLRNLAIINYRYFLHEFLCRLYHFL